MLKLKYVCRSNNAQEEDVTGKKPEKLQEAEEGRARVPCTSNLLPIKSRSTVSSPLHRSIIMYISILSIVLHYKSICYCYTNNQNKRLW